MIDGAASGFNFTIDLNTVMMALIASLIAIVAWFTRKWGLSIESQVGAIHNDLKEHNLHSDAVHGRLFKAISIDGSRISKIEGQLEGRED